MLWTERPLYHASAFGLSLPFERPGSTLWKTNARAIDDL